jgi:hypothetical protein
MIARETLGVGPRAVRCSALVLPIRTRSTNCATHLATTPERSRRKHPRGELHAGLHRLHNGYLLVSQITGPTCDIAQQQAQTAKRRTGNTCGRIRQLTPVGQDAQQPPEPGPRLGRRAASSPTQATTNFGSLSATACLISAARSAATPIIPRTFRPQPTEI